MKRSRPIVIPELLASELLEDATYVRLIFRQRWEILAAFDEDGSLFVSNELVGLLRMSVILTVSGAEALANEELDGLGVLQQQDRGAIEEKWEFLYAEVGVRPKKGHRPWQSLSRLVDLRNKLVHHKPRPIVLGRKPLGSLTFELMRDGGQSVTRACDDVFLLAAEYFTAKGDVEEAARFQRSVGEPEEGIFRTLPWEGP